MREEVPQWLQDGCTTTQICTQMSRQSESCLSQMKKSCIAYHRTIRPHRSHWMSCCSRMCRRGCSCSRNSRSSRRFSTRSLRLSERKTARGASSHAACSTRGMVVTEKRKIVSSRSTRTRFETWHAWWRRPCRVRTSSCDHGICRNRFVTSQTSGSTPLAPKHAYCSS